MWFSRKKKDAALLYTKCSELVIHNFNEASKGNYEYLQHDRTAKVPQKKLQGAWLSILDEFLKISNNIIAMSLMKKQIRIILLQSRLTVFEAMKICIDRNMNIDSELNEYGVTAQNLNSHIGMVKNDIARLINSIPDGLEAKETDANFDQSIATILKNGYQVNRFTTTVSEYAAIVNQIEQQIKNSNKNG